MIICQGICEDNFLLFFFSSYLGELHTAGENAAEYLTLFKSLSWKTPWKIYLCNFGILDTLSQLLIKVCLHLFTSVSKENKTFRISIISDSNKALVIGTHIVSS